MTAIITPKKSIEDYIGNRVLIRNNSSSLRPINEVSVLEVSKSKKYVKIQYLNSTDSHWVLVEDYIVVDELVDALGGE